MILNIEKLNAMYDGDNEDLKELLTILLNRILSSPDSDEEAKFLFYSFDIYDIEDEDVIEQDMKILDVYLLLSLNRDLRKIIISNMSAVLDNEYDYNNEFFQIFMEESGVFIEFGEWERKKRKGKLEKLNGI